MLQKVGELQREITSEKEWYKLEEVKGGLGSEK